MMKLFGPWVIYKSDTASLIDAIWNGMAHYPSPNTTKGPRSIVDRGPQCESLQPR